MHEVQKNERTYLKGIWQALVLDALYLVEPKILRSFKKNQERHKTKKYKNIHDIRTDIADLARM